MPNPLPLIGLSHQDLIWDAGLSMSNEDPDYPVGNAQGINPVPPAKSTTTTTTITITEAGTPVYLALINCNATTGTFEGNAITFPGLDPEGQRLNAVLDLRTLTIGASPWDLVLNVSSGVVWVGRIVLVTAIHELNVKYGWTVGVNRPGEVRIQTRLGTIIRHTGGIRTRWAEGTVDLIEDEATMLALDRGGRGDYLPHLLIPDEDTNDGWWVRQTNPFATRHPDIDVREHSLRFEELSSGPVNG